MSYESRWTGPLRVRHDAVMGIQVLTLDGGLDASTAPVASASVDDALERSGPLVLDLSRLRAIDGDGVSLVRSSMRRMLDAGFDLSVVRPKELNPARAVGGLCAQVGVVVVDGLGAAIEAVKPWQPGGPRWTPERSTPIKPRDEQPRRR
jgi:anti-anti-sigma factor